MTLDDPPHVLASRRRRVGGTDASPPSAKRSPGGDVESARSPPEERVGRPMRPTFSLPQLPSKSRSHNTTSTTRNSIRGGGEGGGAEAGDAGVRSEPRPARRRPLKHSTSSPEPLPLLQQRALEQHASRQRVGQLRASGAAHSPGGFEYAFKTKYGVKE